MPLTPTDKIAPISKESSNERLAPKLIIVLLLLTNLFSLAEEERTSPTDEDSDNSDDFFDATDEPPSNTVTSPLYCETVPIEGDPSGEWLP